MLTRDVKIVRKSFILIVKRKGGGIVSKYSSHRNVIRETEVISQVLGFKRHAIAVQ